MNRKPPVPLICPCCEGQDPDEGKKMTTEPPKSHTSIISQSLKNCPCAYISTDAYAIFPSTSYHPTPSTAIQRPTLLLFPNIQQADKQLTNNRRNFKQRCFPLTCTLCIQCTRHAFRGVAFPSNGPFLLALLQPCMQRSCLSNGVLITGGVGF